MLDLIRIRLAQGTRTSTFPRGPAVLPQRFRGRPQLEADRCPADCADAISGPLIGRDAEGRATIDLGACLFAPEEAAACPHDAVTFSREYRMAVNQREDLISTTGEVELATALDTAMLRLFGRSLRLRSVVAGSCNGCEAELVAAGNVVFDLARFGVQFVASPRHADGIVITGAVNRNMLDALHRTYDAVPAPKIVIAVGACALSGGPFRDSTEVLNGVPSTIPVNLWIPGCPPHPYTMLDGVLRLLRRLEGDGPAAAAGAGDSWPRR